MDKFVQKEMAMLATKRFNLTPSIRSKEDLFRYLESTIDRRMMFFYFKKNEYNVEIWEEIGRLAGLHRSRKHWKAFVNGNEGIISWSGRVMLVTSGEQHYDKGLHMKELRLERVEQ